MNLYLISQTENKGYDTYDSIVVRADSEDAARMIHPDIEDGWDDIFKGWCKSPDQVTVRLLGVAAGDEPAGVVLASYNAG
jgi:hypothetical protein